MMLQPLLAFDRRWRAEARISSAKAPSQPEAAVGQDTGGVLMTHLLLGFCAGLLIAARLLVTGHAWWLALLGYTCGGTLVVMAALGRAALQDLRARTSRDD